MKHTILLLLLCALCVNAQTIEEKQGSLSLKRDEKDLRLSLDALNTQLCHLKKALHKKYEQVNAYQRDGARVEEYQKLLKEINQIRGEIYNLEESWHELTVTEGRGEEDEGYALWDQEETTLSQLVMEYGSNDYLYIIPPEIFSMKLHLHSGIPIPRESWNELLELILSCNGIGIKSLNPYARQLYMLKQDLTAVNQILNAPRDLVHLPPKMRIIYIFSPPPERIRGVIQFFERFRDPKITFFYQVGYKIAIISSREEIEKLLSLYETIWSQENEKIIKAVPLSRIHPEEMEKIIKAYFNDVTTKPRVGLPKGEGEELVTYPLKHKHSLILIGLKEIVKHAEKLVRETEGQVEDPTNMMVSWYTCRYGDPTDIAEVLEKVYASLICADVAGETEAKTGSGPAPPSPSPAESELSSVEAAAPATLPVPATTHITTAFETQKRGRTPSQMTHFIPYPKTGSIMMVVRRDQLDNIKRLIQQLDVPKKMVQIEVLLLEKRIKNENNFGLNLLRLGSTAHKINQTGLKYETGPGVLNRGILDFVLSRRGQAHAHPAFDIAYNFFMNQEDVRIKAAPSITTLNQTPATISLVEEISLDMGATPLETSKGGWTFFSKFVRSQYGTTLTITPTIHTLRDSEDGKHCVTLETNITFDTIKKTAKDDRPPVSRRHITNQVRIVDGETVILGGLCEKTAEDSSNKLPFLGELPGIGKFFGDSRMTDEKTEMFIFITPHIVADNKEELEQLRYEQLIKRPGDLPEFIERIQKAKRYKKEFLFNNSVKLLFGHVGD